MNEQAGIPVPGVGKLEATQRAVMVQGTWSLGEELKRFDVREESAEAVSQLGTDVKYTMVGSFTSKS